MQVLRKCSANASAILPRQLIIGLYVNKFTCTTPQGYRVTGGVLPADPDSHGREPLRKIWVHSALVCTRHGDELRIVNNGNEPWKRLCSIMRPVIDDDDDSLYWNWISKISQNSPQICSWEHRVGHHHHHHHQQQRIAFISIAQVGNNRSWSGSTCLFPHYQI